MTFNPDKSLEAQHRNFNTRDHLKVIFKNIEQSIENTIVHHTFININLN